ncbi:MAG: trypsin-like serine protease [Methyloprofundus sp.]|nr:trypsin-like serine protease [Methyloprofundus sp.]
MSKKNHTSLLYCLLISTLATSNHSYAAQKTAKIIGGTHTEQVKVARIIGGERSLSNAWPWMSGIVDSHSPSINDPFCGATLIAKDWVLTAAHCVIDENSSDIEVIINHAQLDSNEGERIAVKSITIHPLYDDFNLYNDLALIKLAKSSENQSIKVLPPFSSQDSTQKEALALGWGTLSRFTSNYPLDLYQVDLPIISHSHCANTMGKDEITDNMLCAGDGLGQKDTCTGDSGGPLIVFDQESQSWRQAGITSWGYGCAVANEYGVYTRLKNYATFISDHICSEQQSPSPTKLQLAIDDKIVSLSWDAVNNASGYRLLYAPYPSAQPIYSIDMNDKTSFSIELNPSSAFYTTITTYSGNCLSDYSNIEHFIIQ